MTAFMSAKFVERVAAEELSGEFLHGIVPLEYCTLDVQRKTVYIQP
jgi:hypothetical protein